MGDDERILVGRGRLDLGGEAVVEFTGILALAPFSAHE